MNVNISGLARQSSHRWLVNQNARVGKRQTFLAFACGQEQRCHARCLTDADRGYVILHILHGVVDRHARRDRSARRVNVELDIFLRILLRQKKHLRNHQIGDVVIDRGADEDDVIAQQSGVDVVRPLAAAGRLDDHGHQHHSWIVHVHLPHSCPDDIVRFRGRVESGPP